ncbi:AAEL005227-PA [Aedes aegypti]|uniref:AAEL005227-PA n=1 Tax=Aedes aegypti TaxID=7159 RepID=Q17AQ4_AEDAE|nr:AAEL005227-PA [Aedes aegypti]
MNLERFTLVSNKVVEFKSTWRTGESLKLVDTSIGTDPPVPKVDAETAPIERKDVAIQTGGSPRHVSVTCDDAKLSNWLQKIYPLVDEELSAGVTESFDVNDNFCDSTERLTIRKHQELMLKPSNPGTSQKLSMGAAAWLSIATRDAPLLVLACSSYHEAWCDHTYSSITAFTPRRDSYGSVQWVELCSNPVKACIETLETNPFNKDMFAGGTVSGDVYIWQYELNLKNEPNSFSELFSDTTDFGQVVDMAWMRPNPLTKDFGLLSCHSDGIVILWKIGKHIGKDKTFRITTSASPQKAIMLTQILAISNSEFVVGTVDGSILLCSITQLIPIGKGSNAITELQSHSFAVTTLLKMENSRQQFLISCDLTGEVYFHDISDAINSTPTLIIKMPLPFKNKIICSDDMRFILSPNNNGILDVYKIDSGTQESIESGGLSGKPGLIRSSTNGYWLITGPYDGGFIIYSVYKDI